MAKLDQKKQELFEIQKKIKELQKRRKALYNHIYITEMRKKEKENVNWIWLTREK